MQLFRAIATAVGIGIATPIITYYVAPALFLRASVRLRVFFAGMTEKQAKVGDLTYSYMVGGNPKGSKVLLVHGFSGMKEAWIDMIKLIKTNHYVVAVDIPGHGKTTRLQSLEHSPNEYVRRIHEFAHAVLLAENKSEKFHIMGLSLGGMIAGIYGATFSEDLISVSLLCPAGVIGPKETDFQRNIASPAGRAVLVPKNIIEFEAKLRHLSHKKIYIPSKVKQVIMQKNIGDAPWLEKLFSDLIKYQTPLQHVMGKIQAPTLILWGEKDEILHVSAADILHKGIRNSQLYIILDCGHIIDFEKPGKASFYFESFVGPLDAKRRSAAGK